MVLSLKIPFLRKTTEKWEYPAPPELNVIHYLNAREVNQRQLAHRRVPHHKPTVHDSGVDEAGHELIGADTGHTSLSNPNRLSSFVARRIPKLMSPREFDVQGYDKVFASTWLSQSEVVVGTKCNRLLILNVDTGRRFEIPSVIPSSESTPSEPLNFATNMDVSDPLSQSFRQRQTSSVFPPQNMCSGIHSIAINPSRTLLAVGAGRPTEFIQIYRLPSFEPLAVLRGHEDMVFAISWASDSVLVSGSRDTTVKTWSVTPDRVTETTTTLDGTTVSFLNPVCSRQEHRGKVRDLKYNPNTHQAATLSSDGFVKLWDVHHTAAPLNLVSSIPLYHTNETVCMALDEAHNLYAVGSQSHISLLDPRSASIVHMFESCDEGWGVRSMTIDQELLTVGGGLGRISFYDLRSQKYTEWEPLQWDDGIHHRTSTAAAHEGGYRGPMTRSRTRTLSTSSISSSSSSAMSWGPSRTTRHTSSSYPRRFYQNESGISLPPRIRCTMRMPTTINASVGHEGGLAGSNTTASRFSFPALATTTSASAAAAAAAAAASAKYLSTGQGWLCRDVVYQNHFQGMDIRNAVYTLSFDSVGGRLFAA
ncbi:hypothetical protein HK102_007004, partial [Quaeritorhiza haematococci]